MKNEFWRFSQFESPFQQTHAKKDACISQFTPGGGFDFCAAHKISSPGEAYEPARNFVKYKIRKVVVCVDELEQEHFHEYKHTHDHPHEHDHHDHADGHKHPHRHENTKYVQNRLARASGHLQHVRAMVDSGEDCSDVLMQLSAVIGALQSIAKVILKDHLDHCVVDAVQSGDTQTLDDFKKAIDRYIR